MAIFLAVLLAATPLVTEPSFSNGHEMAVGCSDALTSVMAGDKTFEQDLTGCSAYALGVIDAASALNVCLSHELRPDLIITEAAKLPHDDNPSYAKLLLSAANKLYRCN